MKAFEEKNLIIIRGAGDLATACAIRLHNAGFPIIMLEVEKPTVIRTTVSFATAVYQNTSVVEGVNAKLCNNQEAWAVAKTGTVAVVVDPNADLIGELKPRVVVDAILAKRNLGTSRSMADFTVALGPGFEAPKDVNVVIETMRGHSLGSLIRNGSAIANTGIPGLVGGYGKERVMHSPCAGFFESCHKIGDIVKPGEVVARVNGQEVYTEISGKIRGMLTDGLEIPQGFKVADVDPRGESVDHTTCSDKARSIAGGVLEAVMHYFIFGD